MEDEGFGFDDFSVEMQDFQVRRVGTFDRMWHFGPGGSISSGVIVRNGVAYFGCRDHFFYALNPKNGKVIWKFGASDQVGGSTPVIDDGTIYFGCYDYNMYALDTKSGELKWKFKTEGEVGAQCCVDGNLVYFGSRDNTVYALDKRTGKLAWKFRTSDEVACVPTVCGNRLLIGSFDRNLYCLNKLSGELIWKFPTQGEIFSYSPFLAHEGVFYFGSFDNYLRAVDIESGRLIWRFLTGMYGMSSGPVLYRGILYQGCRDGILYALTPEGKMKWKFVTRLMVIPVAAHNNRIYLGSGDYNLYCLDLSGKELWRFPTQKDLIGQFTIHDGKILFGSYDCHLYAVDLDSGSLAWKFRTQGSPCYVPPPFELFEVVFRTGEPEQEEAKKHYDLNIEAGGEEREGAYKSRVTYQTSTRYREKGKYQVDSREEEF